MTIWICKTCGAQHAPSPDAPDHCAICDDERQYLGPNGQEWIERDSITPMTGASWSRGLPALASRRPSESASAPC